MTDVTPAARHTLRILSHLATQRGPIPAGAIASALDLPRSSVYRILGALEDHGYVIHYPEAQRYGLGYAAFALSSGFTRQEPLIRLGSPILAALVERIGETTHLAVLHGTDVIYLLEQQARPRPPLVTDVGVRLPSYMTASGRALLAELPRTQLRALFSAPDAFADGPAGYTYQRLSRELRAATAAGYAIEDEEITRGIASVSVAIRDHAGWPAACMTVSYRKEDIDERAREAIVETLRWHANELSRRIRGSLAAPRS